MKIVIPKPSSPSNPYLDRIHVLHGDVTDQDVDAVISVIRQDLEYRGSINAALLEKAGEQLDEFILEHVYKPQVGDAYAVPGFDLPCTNLIFAIMPVWKDDFAKQERDLLNAVRKAIELATSMNLQTLAIPPIVSGTSGFPKARAARLIVQGIEERLTKGIREVRITCSEKDLCRIFKERLEKTDRF